jgi:hypothetical protein
MKVLKPTEIILEGVMYKMRQGMEIPATVFSFWKSTNQLARLAACGVIEKEKHEITESNTEPKGKK